MRKFKKTLAMLITVCMAVAMMPFAGATNEFGLSGGVADTQNLVADSKTAGYTPYNLNWDSLSQGGYLAFQMDGGTELQFDENGVQMNHTASWYRTDIYLDGRYIGSGGTNLIEPDGYQKSHIGDLFSQAGTYVFVAYQCEIPPSTVPIGEVVVSEPFVYTPPQAQLGAPTNIRFEKEGDKVFVAWDAPTGWVEGRDYFQFDLKFTGKDYVTDMRYLYNTTRFEITDSFKDEPTYNPYATVEASPHGNYVLDIKAKSGDPVNIRSADEFTTSTSTYSYPSGTITNVGITTPPTTTEPTPEPEPQAPATTVSALSTPSKVLVNGTDTAFDAYNIAGNNYFKLRDLANVVSGTEKQFEVTWDAEKNAINLVSDMAYTVVGGEMAQASGMTKTGTLTTSAVYVDGVETAFTAYNIDGNNYFKLRDVAKVFDIGITWDGETSTIGIDTSISYVE